MFSITNGWLQPATHLLSPNFNQRPLPQDISLLVIHCICLPPDRYGGDAIERFFTNRLDPQAHPYFTTLANLTVSSHLLIRREGAVTQFVSFSERAWHAGKSLFEGRDNCNDYSIGIELEGRDNDTYTDAQYATLIAVTRVLQREYPLITPGRIVAHSAIAPTRKTDPGPGFDWVRYRMALG